MLLFLSLIYTDLFYLTLQFSLLPSTFFLMLFLSLTLSSNGVFLLAMEIPFMRTRGVATIAIMDSQQTFYPSNKKRRSTLRLKEVFFVVN